MLRVPAIFLLIISLCINITLSAQETIQSTLVDRDSMRLLIYNGAADSIKAYAAIWVADSYEELNIDSAMYYLQIANTLMDTSQLTLLSARYFLAISKIKRIDGEAAEAVYYGEKALEKYALHNDPSLHGYISIAIAKAYHRLTEYELALEYGLEGAKSGESIGDSAVIAESLDIRGNIMRETNRLDEALKLFQEHYDILMALNQEESAARSLTNIGIVHAVQSDFEPSYIYFKRAIKISEQYNNDYLLAFSAGSLGHTYSRESKIDSAIIYLNVAIKGFAKTNNLFGELWTSSQIGALHIRNKTYDTALKTLVPAYERSKELSTTKLTTGLVKNIGIAYENLDDYKLAYQYQQIGVALQDSMIDEQVLKAVNDAEAKYQNEKKQLEIEQLSLQDEFKSVSINRQRMALGGLTVGVGSLSFLLFRLFGQNKKIKIQNRIITDANNEKEILLKEIHHRVKNNLQVISSLLGIQSLSVTDLKAKEAIQEGRSRVHSMALIHQNLYKKENLTGIEMKYYLKKLSQSILSSYSLQVGQVKIKYEIDDMTLDVDTVVPIGLITNELLANSFKYAFPDDRKGIIKILLKEQSDYLLLSIADDGIGLNPEQMRNKEESFGHSLIRAFRTKLDATIDINGEQGTSVSIYIKNYKRLS